jgi:hypothetical protein
VVSLTNGDRVVTLTGTIQPNDYFTVGERDHRPGLLARERIHPAHGIIEVVVASRHVGDARHRHVEKSLDRAEIPLHGLDADGDVFEVADPPRVLVVVIVV